MTESVKILTANYLDWHAKLTGLPSILTDKIRSKLYKRYKKETGNEPWQLSEAVISISEKLQASDFKPITFEARPDPELIIKSILKHFPYLKFQNSFRGIDNYNFASPQPWSSPYPICDGKHGNYGLHGEWIWRRRTFYRKSTNRKKKYTKENCELQTPIKNIHLTMHPASRKLSDILEKLAKLFGLNKQSIEVYSMLSEDIRVLEKKMEDYHSKLKKRVNQSEKSVGWLGDDVEELHNFYSDLMIVFNENFMRIVFLANKFFSDPLSLSA
ncbi:hypothetical protein RhiirA5_380540 [Rhizophagus irregularis]|uniref:Uncharacterized protein n=1 Tax=Rhizophagus irregularis TaxID=588596 RepID=A0A2N0P813_9GLOM|nr:hypothetical protein RhiirA5_380540 [Rhizophagus irregularis]